MYFYRSTFTTFSHQTVLAHDFFSPQPIKDADIFLLRTILHDWSDKYALQILRHLRAAATPTTRLLVLDQILSYACPDDSLQTIPGVATSRPPAPLLPNGGYAAAVGYYIDMQMVEMCNGRDRTAAQLVDLLAQAGWKAERVVLGGATSLGKVIATPA